MARMISKQTGKAIVDYVDYKYSPTVGLQYLSCYVALILVLLTIAYLIMTMHVFSMNTAGGDSSRLTGLALADRQFVIGERI